MKGRAVLADLLRFLQGFLTGTGAVLPGVSGGALCMSFGYYLPLIEIVSNPLAGIKKHLRLALAFGLGWLVSFFVCAKLTGALFTAYELQGTLIFGGLIIGSLPSLVRDAGRATKGCYIGAAGGYFAIAAVMIAVTVFSVDVTPNAFWYAFNGFLWGLSLIFPGLNTTPITVSLGVYDAWASGVGAFDLGVLLPWLAALVVTAFVLSRTVSSLVKKHMSVVSWTMIGVVSSSTLIMLVQTVAESQPDLIGILLMLPFAAAGILIAFLLDKITRKEIKQ